ncbi:tyrosine-type recombinase/integrase [Flavobacteriaceae bacterium S356]|uniref:Tyrosine-type recombinase/integrase n=1 Tax=Asprobacillus argus TaxID=3076534 RepID=A0ABU3LIH3_9FLAO|nr:tyrosine-type recombinase/integrase [Flavobacteriaceae bacterium S356]
MSHLLDFKTILEIKRYSQNTIESYMSSLNTFTKEHEYTIEILEKLSDKDIILSSVNSIKKKNYSVSSQKQLIGALKLFYKEIFKRSIDFSIIYPTRKSEHLPSILSKKEMYDIITSTENCKHKTIIATIYGLGLRISELINLCIVDIDSDRMLVTIKNSKGKKDRVIMLPNNLLLLLRKYFIKYRPKVFLFEGVGYKKYSDSSIRKILKKAVVNCEIRKHVTVHTLRHSFATHLLENGTDIRIIQKLLGHKNINTTLVYVKVADSTIKNVKSPIEDLIILKTSDVKA